MPLNCGNEFLENGESEGARDFKAPAILSGLWTNQITSLHNITNIVPFS
jgi:hypothetical protein